MSIYSIKIENFLRRKWLLVLVLIFLLFFQLIYSILCPAVGSNNMWLSPNSYLPKFSVQSSDNFILEKIYPLISPQYRLTNDTGHYIELARNFNAESLKRSPIFERPLYSLLIRLTSSIFQVFTPSSYGITFVSAILLNFILAAFTVLLFFKTLGKLFPLRIAYLSSILLIFSPFFHIFLIQAVPSILSAFTAVVSLYLLQDYIKKSSIKKLILFSLIIGILLLGKMFFSISFFILLLALYFKRYREGIVFSAVHLIPFGLWYLWLTKIWQIPYSSYEVNYYQAESWVFNIFQWPWNQTFQIFLRSVPNFFESLIYGFILLPVIFSIIGLKKFPFRFKNLFYFGSIFAVFLLLFLIDAYYARVSFLLFPVIYPAAVSGIEEVSGYFKKYNSFCYYLCYAAILAAIIIISNINIYKVFYYD